MKTIMILGAGILQLPGIIKAKEMGLKVIAVDKDENAIGFNHVDVSLSISTNDTVRVLEYAKKYNIDAIMTLASDMPMKTVAAVAEELNLPSITTDTAEITTNKIKMRECLEKNNIPIPKYFKVKEYNEYLTYTKRLSIPFIVKPSDNSGSRGVYLVKKLSEIDYAYKYSTSYSKDKSILIEEYLVGPEYSVETISYAENNHIIAITEKLTSGAPNFVEMGHSIPARITEQQENQIKQVVSETIKAVGIKNGVSHTEIIYTELGPKIVEIGARLGGDNITSHLVPLSTGIDMIEALIHISLGNQPNVDQCLNKGSAIRFLSSKEGTINKIVGLDVVETIEGIKEVKILKNISDEVVSVKNSLDRLGYVIAQASDSTGAIDICQKAIKKIKVEIK